MILTRRGFLKGLLGAVAVAAVPTKTYSFVWDNPLAAPHATSGMALTYGTGSGAFRRALQHEMDQLREDFAWHMNDGLLWKPSTPDDAFEVTLRQYTNLTVEKPNQRGRLTGITVPARNLWGRIAIGTA